MIAAAKAIACEKVLGEYGDRVFHGRFVKDRVETVKEMQVRGCVFTHGKEGILIVL